MRAVLLVFLSIFTVSFLADAGSRGAAADKDEKAIKKEPAKIDREALKKVMTRKLEASQKLLKALALNRLDDAAAEAEELKKIRKDAGWLVKLRGKQEDYDMWSKDYIRSLDKIIKGGKEQNGEASKMGYLEMTHSCFGCHNHVRDYAEINFERETH